MNLKLFRNLLAISFFTSSALRIFAQDPTSQTQYFVPQPFPRSPTATALEKYGSYQVNEFTGVPDISIPLYTVEAGGLQVPITLSYHASGNKVTDVASSVGLGWAVSAGGQISRRVQGLPDDGSNGYLLGKMHVNGTINYTTEAGVDYLESASNGTYDTKPDIYSYDFPGHSGKFFFDGSAGDGTYPVRMLPYAPVKVSYVMGQHFTIVDEHGNRYLYGDAASDSTTSGGGGRTSITTKSAWKIENMISQNRRDTISFTYINNKITYPSADGETYTVVDAPAGENGYAATYHASYLNTPPTPGVVNITYEKDPSQINFKNRKVVFDMDDTARTDINLGGGGIAYGLRDMKVYIYNFGTKAYDLQKSVVFYKSYFINSGGTKRLRLDSIQVLDKAGSIMQHYRFDYNTTINLPDYTSKAQDYWGYFNNVNNSLLTPQQSIPYQSCESCGLSYVTIGSDHLNGRVCDSTQMQAYILTGIHYPSGGYSTFTYQTNRVDSSGVHLLAGGLRVSTISSYDGISSTPIVKTYVYNIQRANYNLSNDYFITAQKHQNWQTGQFESSPSIHSTAQIRSFSSNPHTDLEGLDGATVVYPSVTEYIGTPGTNVGRTDYTFTDMKDDLLMASMSGTQIYDSYFYARGHLQNKKEYIHKSDGTYQPVKYEHNTYSAFPATDYPDVALAVFKTVYNEGAASNPWVESGFQASDDRRYGTYVFPYYKISSDDNYLISSTTKIYDTNDTTKYTSSTVTYHYDDTVHQQVASTTHVDSKGNTHITVNRHAYDYINGGATTHNVLLDTMIQRHMYADEVEKYDSLMNVTTSVNSVISGQLNYYTTGASGAIIPLKISTLSVPRPLTNFVKARVVSGNLSGDNRYVQMISFDNYDAKNNLLQYTARNATPTSIMWNYNYELPVAQVKNATILSSGSNAIFYTSFEADSKGNWTYSGTPAINPTAPTGSYVYPLSAGNITSGALPSALSFVLSLWSNNGPPTVYNGSTYLTDAAFNTANGWTYYEYQVPAGSASITISGTTSVDEVRMYPAAAQMTTYVYDPSGIRSISDTKGTSSYFEYDFAQRLKNVKDWAGNIVKNYAYHMYDMTYGNQVQTATFTRDNCPYGTTPTSLTYTVPVNKYFSSTLASANAEAIYDMNTNGQSKADANCGCPINYINVALTNSTGLTGWTVVFSGISTPFNFPSSGTANIQVPQGNYATAYIGPLGSTMHTFTMGGFAPVTYYYTTFSPVVIAPGSANLTLSVQ